MNERERRQQKRNRANQDEGDIARYERYRYGGGDSATPQYNDIGSNWSIEQLINDPLDVLYDPDEDEITTEAVTSFTEGESVQEDGGKRDGSRVPQSSEPKMAWEYDDFTRGDPLEDESDYSNDWMRVDSSYASKQQPASHRPDKKNKTPSHNSEQERFHSTGNKTEALDPGWGAGFDDEYFETQEQIREGISEVAPGFFNLALDFTPIVGDIKGVAEAIIGKDILDRDLAVWERALGAIPFFGGILKKGKAFIKLPGIWVAVENVGKRGNELIEYLASKLPSWKNRTVFAMAGEGGYEAPSQVHQGMIHAIEGGANAGQSLLQTYLPKFTSNIWQELKLTDTIKKIITHGSFTNQQREEIIDTLLNIQSQIDSKKIDLADSGLQKNFREVVKKLNSNQYNIVEENLAELDSALKAIESGNVDGAVAIGVTKGQKPKNLPEIDVDKVEADTYYKDKSGALHLVEVKNTPNAFVSKLKEAASREAKDQNYEGQFTRYQRWMKKGSDQGQVRRAMVYIRNSEPKFHEIIDKDILEILSDNIAKENTTETILQVKNVQFSFDELQKFTKDAYRKLGELKKQNKKASFSELADRYFNSMEQAFETLGKTYGH